MEELGAIQETINSLKKEIEELRRSSLRLIFGKVVAYIPLPKPTVSIEVEEPCPGVPNILSGVDLVLQSGGFGSSFAGAAIMQRVAVLVSGDYKLAFAVLKDGISPEKLAASYRIGFDTIGNGYMEFVRGKGLTINSFGNTIEMGPTGINIKTMSKFSLNGASVEMKGNASVVVETKGKMGIKGMGSVTVDGQVDVSIKSSGNMSLNSTGPLSIKGSTISNSAGSETH